MTNLNKTRLGRPDCVVEDVAPGMVDQVQLGATDEQLLDTVDVPRLQRNHHRRHAGRLVHHVDLSASGTNFISLT